MPWTGPIRAAVLSRSSMPTVRPDVVIFGINSGLSIGVSILHLSTVGPRSPGALSVNPRSWVAWTPWHLRPRRARVHHCGLAVAPRPLDVDGAPMLDMCPPN